MSPHLGGIRLATDGSNPSPSNSESDANWPRQLRRSQKQTKRLLRANRVVITSDRRVAAWGALRANWIYLKVGARWGLGLRKGLERHYPDVR